MHILNMTNNNGRLEIRISSPEKDLQGCIFELYVFDFLKNEYRQDIKQIIKEMHIQKDTANYRFIRDVPNDRRIKCVISENDKVLLKSEKFLGTRHKIILDSENSPLGVLYKLKSDISVSRNAVSYKLPTSKTKLSIPDDILVGEVAMFKVKDRSFFPTFEISEGFSDSFILQNGRVV